MIPAEARPALEGVIPSVIATISKDGVPNCSYISQVWFVDPTHVAISHQFFNKTMQNLKDVPFAQAQAFDPRNLDMWQLTLRHVGTQTDGPVFEQMELQLEAVGSAARICAVRASLTRPPPGGRRRPTRPCARDGRSRSPR